MELLMLLPMLFWLAMIGGGFYLALRLVHAFERRGTDRQEVQELRGQVLRLEEALESVTRDTERLAEEQRFMTKLLSERSGTPAP